MKKFASRVLMFSIVAFAFLLQISNFAFATDIQYISANISVMCEKNGTAHINEIWEIKVNSGTEMYLVRDNLEKQSISNLKVLADGKEYQNIGNWNTKASFNDKAYKCGIVRNGSEYELCWGLSSYGNRTFNISYDISNLVKECSDGSFIEQLFINKRPYNLETAKITIESKGTQFTNENTKMWAGGGATGNVFIENGKIVAQATDSMLPEAKFSILAQFDKEIFSPEVFKDTTFEKLKSKNLQETDYQKNYENEQENMNSGSYYYSEPSLIQKIFSYVFPIIISVIIAFTAIIIFLKTARTKDNLIILNDKLKKQYKHPDYSRNLPFQDNIFATYTRLHTLGKLQNESSIIGVYILKWIQHQEINLVKVETKKFFKTKFEDAIELKELNNDVHPLEKELFDMMLEASDENHILVNKDFEKWCSKNWSSFEGWLKKCNKEGLSALKKMGAVVENNKKFMGLIKYTRNEITEVGIKLTSEMFGFKKYLEDFTIINEREAKEVELWGDYIIYAQLFGIADKVSKQFKNLYPSYFEERFNLDQNKNIDIFVVNNLMNNFIHTAQTAHNTYVNSHNSNAETALAGLGGSFSGGGFSGVSGSSSHGDGIR
jgi:uncharacterized membrane protein